VRIGRDRIMPLRLGCAVLLVGITICIAFAPAARAAPVPDPEAFLWGGWAADEALRFDPFTLRTLPLTGVVRRPSVDAAEGVLPAAGVDLPASGSVALVGGAGEAGPTSPRSLSSPGDPPPLPYVPPVRIPYRPPLRSPFRPPM